MNAENAISAIAAQLIQQPTQIAATQASLGTNATQGSGFFDLVSQGLSELDQQLKVSQTDLQQLALGNVENLHQVMIRLEQSQFSLQFLMQIRNRALEAYQEIMRMSV